MSKPIIGLLVLTRLFFHIALFRPGKKVESSFPGKYGFGGKFSVEKKLKENHDFLKGNFMGYFASLAWTSTWILNLESWMFILANTRSGVIRLGLWCKMSCLDIWLNYNKPCSLDCKIHGQYKVEKWRGEDKGNLRGCRPHRLDTSARLYMFR